MSLIRRSGPAESGQTTSTPPSADTDLNVPRCQRCQRGISAPQSVARMHGPVCWHRRFDAAIRSTPLDCNCRDPWVCNCTAPPLSDNAITGYRDAAEYIMATSGCTPLLPVEVLRALYRRGGNDRALAEQLRNTAGQVIA